MIKNNNKPNPDNGSSSFESSSQFFSTNIIYINELYQRFINNPNSVDKSWAEFFIANEDEIKSVLIDYQGPSWIKRDLKVLAAKDYDISNLSKKEVVQKSQNIDKESSTQLLLLKLQRLAIAYRRYGHLAANIDPLGLAKKQTISEITPSNYDISEQDLSLEIDFKNLLGLGKASVQDFIDKLGKIYTSNIGCEFEYIVDSQQKAWLASEVETATFVKIDQDEKLKILNELIRSERFEQFLHKRFPGAKRFSVEGGETSINAIEKIIDYGAKNGIKKICLGMAHRGRLNVLTGVMGKPYSDMIAEFQGAISIPQSITKSGDVKYHMGYSSTRVIAGNEISLSLAFNPSHLEAVNSVVAGKVRAKQDMIEDSDHNSVMAVLIHGDAAFIGQGSVAESLVLNTVPAYDTKGVIHIITNNQIGFTANPWDSRGTTYASDLAKMIEAPIFHVNGDDVEAVIKVAEIAAKYRQKFKKDIVIDLICYRKYGHNEGDEPMYTQPLMYSKIKSHPTPQSIYAKKIIDQGIITSDKHQELLANFDKNLSNEFEKAKSYEAKADWLRGVWKDIKHDVKELSVVTKIAKKTLKNLIDNISQIPKDFSANSKIVKQLEARKENVHSEKDIDWGCAESLAFASLIQEGHLVRISGQDSGRGTFSHRHSILHNTEINNRHNIFSNLGNSKIKYEVYDSVLSEYAVLGFEYGYSLANPNALTIWEAQFGDFANGAQIIFDQFIASSEVKWLRKSGLVMLLPHGYEGQGPEHSSARLERYLQACADNNLRVVNITSPANFFHALRRQIHSKDRKPLVVMSPKSLLRHKMAVSNLSEFSDNNFKPIIGENEKLVNDEKITKLILCSGKVYYDLIEARADKKINDIAIIRIEQLYPYPKDEINNELKKYKNAQIIWCQEEPKNMGAWKFIEELIEESLSDLNHNFLRPQYVGRISSASPATGYASQHKKEQEELINQALSR
jgi:2-oxoglutarate dehydrogenase E1 component